MGIENIHILINPDVRIDEVSQQAQILAQHQVNLVEAHRRGEHSWGSMCKDCPLCQAS